MSGLKTIKNGQFCVYWLVDTCTFIIAGLDKLGFLVVCALLLVQSVGTGVCLHLVFIWKLPVILTGLARKATYISTQLPCAILQVISDTVVWRGVLVNRVASQLSSLQSDCKLLLIWRMCPNQGCEWLGIWCEALFFSLCVCLCTHMLTLQIQKFP